MAASTTTPDVTARPRLGGQPALLYAGTTFLSAFLLFQVQPLIGKAILPWFGGGSAIWTTTMLFFQVALLGGYAYAHFISSRLSLRRQGYLHIALLAAAILAGPIIPNPIWKPEEAGDPTLRVLLVLALTVGAPYTLLSATAPLIQRWFSYDHPGVSPYRLYSLSNIGSLLALLTYPMAFERFLGLQMQAMVWYASYVAFAACCAWLAWRVARRARAGEVIEEPEEEGGTATVTPGNIALWLLLPALASAALLAFTNQLTQDVASIPLLWVMPLALYLLTFIVCFGNHQAYRPIRDVPLLAVALAAGALVLNAVTIPLLWQVLVYSASLFVICFTLHGELVRLRPGSRQLTAFYLMVSIGGALGGVFVALIAPAIFTGYWEYHVVLVTTGLLVLIARGIDIKRQGLPEAGQARGALFGAGALAALGLVALAALLANDALGGNREALQQVRNFYGTVRVFAYNTSGADGGMEIMVHGRILHGFQFLGPEKRAARTGYYGPKSGLGVAMQYHPKRGAGTEPMRVGVLGLGAGMLGAYAERGDNVSIYEINDQVVTLAEEEFTYLKDARARGAQVETLLGDGRLVLERQLKESGPLGIDVLVLDAFTSDAVPMHLLTKEAMDLYWQHLKPDGVLAINISNRHVDLSPVLRGTGAAAGKDVRWVSGQADDSTGVLLSVWVLMTSNRAFLDRPDVANAFSPWPEDARAPMIWTDDFSTIYDLLHLY